MANKEAEQVSIEMLSLGSAQPPKKRPRRQPLPTSRLMANRYIHWTLRWIRDNAKLVIVLAVAILLLLCIILPIISTSSARSDILQSLNSKTTMALQTVPKNAAANRIWSKIGEGCLELKLIDSSSVIFIRPSAKCTDRSIYQQHFTSSQYLDFGDEEKFMVKVIGEQVDVKNERVYFALQSVRQSHLCLALCRRDCTSSGEIIKVKLFECDSTDDEQMFYLKDGVDYSAEFAQMADHLFIRIFGL